MLKAIYEKTLKEAQGFTFPISGWEGENFINTDGYQIWLAHYVKIYKPEKSLELGRRYGNSLYAMSYFLPDECHLDSLDLNMRGNVVNKPNVNVSSYDGDFSKLDLSIYSFIFVDINGLGDVEYAFYNQLLDQNFVGVVAWDDVGDKWCPDDKFWDKISCEKLKVPLHGNYFGLTLHRN